jgi:2-dehydropantoate 2-reductase
MQIAIVTAGAVGAYFGYRFLKTDFDIDITFVARGQHLEALQEDGLAILTNKGAAHIPPSSYRATDDAAEAVKDADLVLFAVKSHDTENVARSLLLGLGKKTIVLSLQNGVDNEEILAEIVGMERTAGGVAYVFAQLTEPGVVSCPGDWGRFVLADKTLAGQPLPHLDELRELCAAAEIPCEVTPDIAKVKWTKLVFNTALNGWTTYHRTTLDKLLADPDRRAEFIATMQETVVVAKATGVNLDPDLIEKTVANAEKLGTVGSSMLGDLEQGRKLELDALNGTIVRRGVTLGVPTPYNQQIYDALKKYV